VRVRSPPSAPIRTRAAGQSVNGPGRAAGGVSDALDPRVARRNERRRGEGPRRAPATRIRPSGGASLCAAPRIRVCRRAPGRTGVRPCARRRATRQASAHRAACRHHDHHSCNCLAMLAEQVRRVVLAAAGDVGAYHRAVVHDAPPAVGSPGHGERSAGVGVETRGHGKIQGLITPRGHAAAAGTGNTRNCIDDDLSGGHRPGDVSSGPSGIVSAHDRSPRGDHCPARSTVVLYRHPSNPPRAPRTSGRRRGARTATARRVRRTRLPGALALITGNTLP